MGDIIIVTAVVAAVFFIVRSQIRKFCREQCIGGCAGCSGSCCGCMESHVEETGK